MKIFTIVDGLLLFIEKTSPVKESLIPAELKNEKFEDYINILENVGMIEVKGGLFNERVFIFKRNTYEKTS